MGETPEDQPPTVSVRVSGPYLYSRATHESLRQLKTELESDEYQVQIPFAYPHATPHTDAAALEHIGLWIGGGVSTAMLTLITQDIYKGAKRWYRARFKKNADTPASYITIYGPDDKPLKHILAKSADDIREIEPNAHDEENGLKGSN